MESRNYIEEELQALAPAIVQIDKSNVYSVSPNYFNDLTANILEKVQAGFEPVYYFIKINPYKVPEGYFDELAKSILQKVKKEKERTDVFTEMESISPLLNTISKKPVYSVPEDFFDQKVSPPNNETFKPTLKVASTRVFTTFIKYAAAAVITALLAVSMYLLINKNSNITEQKINPTAEVKKLSESEIADFLRTNFSAEDVSSASNNASLIETDIKKSVREMSDKEIQQFLQEEGETDEI